MGKASNWFVRNTQQAVMSRTAILPVLARTGPNSKNGTAKKKKHGNEIFIVGESEVGGEHVVGGTP